LGRIFSHGGNGGALGSKKVTKTSHVEGSSLKGALDKDYKRASSRTVLPTEWVCEEFLSHNGLQEDFITMYKHATWEFLSTLSCWRYAQEAIIK
jgi:hypothetical protein